MKLQTQVNKRSNNDSSMLKLDKAKTFFKITFSALLFSSAWCHSRPTLHSPWLRISWPWTKCIPGMWQAGLWRQCKLWQHNAPNVWTQLSQRMHNHQPTKNIHRPQLCQDWRSEMSNMLPLYSVSLTNLRVVNNKNIFCAWNSSQSYDIRNRTESSERLCINIEYTRRV